MHVTLAFLGATPDARLAEVVIAVTEAVADTRQFTAALDRVGRFPDHGSPRVVWLGIGPGAHELSAIADGVRESLAARGLPFDQKPFRPHVTLARVSERAE